MDLFSLIVELETRMQQTKCYLTKVYDTTRQNGAAVICLAYAFVFYLWLHRWERAKKMKKFRITNPKEIAKYCPRRICLWLRRVSTNCFFHSTNALSKSRWVTVLKASCALPIAQKTNESDFSDYEFFYIATAHPKDCLELAGLGDEKICDKAFSWCNWKLGLEMFTNKLMGKLRNNYIFDPTSPGYQGVGVELCLHPSIEFTAALMQF